jgi:hypothetical protein
LPPRQPGRAHDLRSWLVIVVAWWLGVVVREDRFLVIPWYDRATRAFTSW